VSEQIPSKVVVTEKVPHKVVVTRTFTYDVESLMVNWAQNNGGIRPTWEEALELIREWAYEDMTSDAENLDFQFIPGAEAGA
jgi:hypothetical protein